MRVRGGALFTLSPEDDVDERHDGVRVAADVEEIDCFEAVGVEGDDEIGEAVAAVEAAGDADFGDDEFGIAEDGGGAADDFEFGAFGVDFEAVGAGAVADGEDPVEGFDGDAAESGIVAGAFVFFADVEAGEEGLEGFDAEFAFAGFGAEGDGHVGAGAGGEDGLDFREELFDGFDEEEEGVGEGVVEIGGASGDADIDDGAKPGLSSDERAELVKLRRANRVLEMEVEILKEAVKIGRGNSSRDSHWQDWTISSRDPFRDVGGIRVQSSSDDPGG